MFGRKADPLEQLGTRDEDWQLWTYAEALSRIGARITDGYDKAAQRRHREAVEVMAERRRLAEAALRADDADAALRYLEAAIRDGSIDPWFHEQASTLYHRGGRYADYLRATRAWLNAAEAQFETLKAVDMKAGGLGPQVQQLAGYVEVCRKMVARAEQLDRERGDDGKLRGGADRTAPPTDAVGTAGPGLAARASIDKEIARFLEPLGTTYDDYLDYWRKQRDAAFGEVRKDPRIEKAEDTAVARYNLAEACRLKGRDDLALLLHAANVRDQVPFPASYNKLISACHKAKDYRGEVDAIDAFLSWQEAQDRFYGPPRDDLQASQRIAARAKLEARRDKAQAKLDAAG